MSSKKNALNVKHLHAAYEDTIILNDLSFSIPTGVRCAVVGPNGAGKTTLLKCILDLHKPLLGTISYFEKSFDKARDHIAYVPQRKTIDWMFPITAYETVLMGTYKLAPFYKKLPDNAHDITLHALNQVDLAEYAQSPISQLSGGQQQRIFVARALAQQADLYILDEPFTGVDKKTEKALVAVFDTILKSGKTLIAVHHDLTTIKTYFDWIILINKNIFYCGPITECSNLDTYIEQTFNESF